MPTGAGQVALLPAPGAHARRPRRSSSRRSCRSCRTRSRASSARRPGARRSSTPSRTRPRTARRSRARRRASVKLLYVAPERFSSPGFLEAMRDVDVGLFVVDEAHCVSQWGHDFRPDYFRLADAARLLGARAIVASTATATPQVADDIAGRLACATRCASRPDSTARTSPSRSSRAAARPTSAPASPRRWRTRPRGPAIVYAGTRADDRADRRRPRGGARVETVAYHAGLPRAARAIAQRRFMAGEVEVVVATNAFGMGVDKADVRTVAHASVPGSVEAYYQEAGRAGRDGAPARALLLAEARDKGLHVFFIERARGRRRAPSRRSPTASARPSACCRSATPAGRSTSASASSATIPSACARSSATSPGRAWSTPRPSPPDRLRGRLEAPFDGARAGGVPRVGGRGASARAGASTARCGRSSRATAAAGRRSCATSATTASPVADRCRAATSARRALVPAAPAAAGGAWAVPAVAARGSVRARRPRRRDPHARVDGRARGRAHARGRDPARRAVGGAAPPRLRRAAGLRRVRPPAGRRRPRPRRRAARHRAPRLDRRPVSEAPRRGGAGGVRVGVLASGEGTNLQALLDAVHGREVEIVARRLRPAGGAGARARARRRACRRRVFARADYAARAERDAAMADWLDERDVALVVLAGYMAILEDVFLERFAGRIVNVHPSLLPAFPGVRAIEQALAYGAKVFGVTVHYVEPGEVDSGPVILQGAVELPGAREPADVLARAPSARARAAAARRCAHRRGRGAPRPRTHPPAASSWTRPARSRPRRPRRPRGRRSRSGRRRPRPSRGVLLSRASSNGSSFAALRAAAVFFGLVDLLRRGGRCAPRARRRCAPGRARDRSCAVPSSASGGVRGLARFPPRVFNLAGRAPRRGVARRGRRLVYARGHRRAVRHRAGRSLPSPARSASAARCCPSPTSAASSTSPAASPSSGSSSSRPAAPPRRSRGRASRSAAIDDFTGFPEIMDGRVKTLHPKLYAGLLARARRPRAPRGRRAEHDIEFVDLVCVNLYPFERTAGARGVERRRGHREHRHRRPDDDPRGGEEPRVRRGRSSRPESYDAVLEELRDAGGRAVAADARVARRRGVLLHRALRHGDRALVRGEGARTSRRCSCAPTRRSSTCPTARTRTSARRTTRRSARACTCCRMVRQHHGKQISFNNLLDLDAARALRRASSRCRRA